MRLRFPLVVMRRSTADQLHDKLEAAEANRRRQQQALARMGHRVDEIYRETGKLVTDLRLVRYSFEHSRSGRVSCTFELVDEMLYRAFRHDSHFREVLSYLLERAFMEEYGPGAPYGIFDDRKVGILKNRTG